MSDGSHVAAEEHRRRSERIRELVQGPDATPPPETKQIPKVIVQFWDNEKTIPADVGECLESWEALTGAGGFERAFFDDTKAVTFIARNFDELHTSAFEHCRHPAMRCDYFRLCYLARNGGFYVDADDVYRGADVHHLFADDRLKLQPLCYDTTTTSMVDAATFMARGAYSADWIFYVNNNPLIAPASHPLVELALARATDKLLRSDGTQVDIQAMTGPGNLTASLVEHVAAAQDAGEPPRLLILRDWDSIAVSRWPLSYRSDERNWRRWRAGS